MTLDAAGFLLLAEGHLVKAKEKLYQEPSEPSPRATYLARLDVIDATNLTRHALKLLSKKEEPCKES